MCGIHSQTHVGFAQFVRVLNTCVAYTHTYRHRWALCKLSGCTGCQGIEQVRGIHSHSQTQVGFAQVVRGGYWTCSWRTLTLTDTGGLCTGCQVWVLDMFMAYTHTYRHRWALHRLSGVGIGHVHGIHSHLLTQVGFAQVVRCGY